MSNELLHDRCRAFLARYEPHALPRHEGTIFDLPLDDGTTQAAGPEPLDLALHLRPGELPRTIALDGLLLQFDEGSTCLIRERANRRHETEE